MNAIPTLCRERAERAGAAVSDDHADEPGWLGGLPIAIKDLTEVAGVPMTMGTAGLADYVPETSDPLVRRLEARSGIVVGKSNTPEFGADANTFNDVFGITRNPWDTRLNAGGSSGGSAAALATGRCGLPRDRILPVPCAHPPPIAAWSGCDQVLALGDTFRYDVLIYMSFLLECWAQIASTNPLERVNREVKRSTDVKGIFPDNTAVVRLVGALMLETNDEWPVAQRYMNLETLARISAFEGQGAVRTCSPSA